jgi:hypothetical protein
VPRLPPLLARALPYSLLFAGALLVGAELARPFRSASIAFDSQAAVLYFERIIAGQRLEGFVPTTPKPLLTVIFGLLYQATHDWRSLAWVTLVVDALAVTLFAVLAKRVGSPVAGAFVGVALAINANLLFDVGYALGSPYALLGWAIAGLAMIPPRPRYALAGLGLAFAALARAETFVLIGVAFLAVAWSTLAPPRWRVVTVPRRAWLVPLGGLLALPIMLAHDLLLTGDPFYWASVASRYAAETDRHLPTALQVMATIMGRYWAVGGLSVLAVVGVLRLLEQRRYGALTALLGLGPAIAVFLVLLAARGIDVPLRYMAAIDVAVVFAAGVGIEAVSLRVASLQPLEPLVARVRTVDPMLVTMLAVAVIAVLLAGPYWRDAPDIRSNIRSSLRLAIDADRAVPYLSAGLALTDQGSPGTVLLLVPGPIRPRIVVDLGLSLTQVGSTAAARIDIAAGYPAAGQLVFHDRAGDGASAGWAQLEIDAPRTIGSVVLEPLLADARAGVWVVALR